MAISNKERRMVMSHTISYKDLPQEQADTKAMEDVKFWLGDKFDFVDNTLREAVQKGEIKTLKHLCFYASFIGIQGYPVMMLARRYSIVL
jgi:hypothetical protein